MEQLAWVCTLTALCHQGLNVNVITCKTKSFCRTTVLLMYALGAFLLYYVAQFHLELGSLHYILKYNSMLSPQMWLIFRGVLPLTPLFLIGRKGRSYLLILLRLNQLAMETIDGSIFYTLRKNDS